MTIYRLENTEDSNRYKLITQAGVILVSLISVISLFLLIYFVDVDNILVALLQIIAFLYIPLSIYFINRYFLRLGEPLASTEIELGKDYILFRQKHKPDIRIQQDEISQVTNQKGLTVYAENKARAVYIPDNLVDYDEVKSIVADWTSPIPASKGDSIEFVALLIVISFGIIISSILVVVTRSLWLLVLIILLVLGRQVYFAWLNSQSIDLTLREKRLKFIYYSISFLFFIYFLFVVIRNIVN